MDNSAIMCDKIEDSFDEEGKLKLSHTMKQILMKRKQPVKCKISIF